MINPVPKLGSILPTTSDGYDRYGTTGRTHKGLDIMYRRESKGTTDLPIFAPWYYMPNGVPALAMLPGKVTRAGTIGTGGRVEIDHGNGLVTKYYHLRNLAVKAGDTVRAGQPVGTIYHNPDGYKLNHLHFEVLKNGNHVDPAPYIKDAKVISPPGLPTWLKIGLVVGAGLWASRYIR